MLDPVFTVNQTLRTRLSSLIESQAGNSCVKEPVDPGMVSVFGAETDSTTPIHVVVTANEVNHLHGTGPLVQRIFKGRRNVFSIRARNDWGVHDFGDWNVCLSPRARNRSEAF